METDSVVDRCEFKKYLIILFVSDDKSLPGFNPVSSNLNQIYICIYKNDYKQLLNWFSNNNDQIIK